MITEKQQEIASEAVAYVVKSCAERGYALNELSDIAEAAGRALVNGFTVINNPEQLAKVDLMIMLDDPAAQKKIVEVAASGLFRKGIGDLPF